MISLPKSLVSLAPINLMFELHTHYIGIVSEVKFQRFVANVQKKLVYEGGCDQYGTMLKNRKCFLVSSYMEHVTILVLSSEEVDARKVDR